MKQLNKLYEQENNLEYKLKLLKDKINRLEINKNWEPNLNQCYYYIESNGFIEKEINTGCNTDCYRLLTKNCFETQNKAEIYKELVKTKSLLKELAQQLNNNIEIDFEENNIKYFIYLDLDENILKIGHTKKTKISGNIYCLKNKEFLAIAQNRIGTQKIIDMIKAGV